MPWWLYIYLAVISVVVTMAVRDDVQGKTAIPFVLAEVVAMGLLVLAALSYWVSAIGSMLGSGAPVFYSAAVAWLVVGTVRELRSLTPTPTLAVSAGSILFFSVLYGPLIYWGFVSTFGRVQNGT